MTENDKRNIATARLLYTGAAAERASIAPDIVWHVPGHNPVSGIYNGFEAYTQMMPARMAPLTRWDFELEDAMVNGNYVVTRIKFRGELKGKKVDQRGAHILRFNDSGQIAEGWRFTSDQDALDDFFAA